MSSGGKEYRRICPCGSVSVLEGPSHSLDCHMYQVNPRDDRAWRLVTQDEPHDGGVLSSVRVVAPDWDIGMEAAKLADFARILLAYPGTIRDYNPAAVDEVWDQHLQEGLKMLQSHTGKHFEDFDVSRNAKGFTTDDLMSLLLPVLALCEGWLDKVAEYDASVGL